MSLPSKSQQIAAVAKFLDSDKTEGRELNDIAKEIVEGYLDALTKGIKKPAQPVRLGMLFKDPVGKVRRVAWLEDDLVWLVSDNSSYGWLGRINDEVWSYCEEYRPKRRAEGKLVEMTDDGIAEEWDNPDWKVGDRLSQRQRQHQFEVIAVGPQCVLMIGDTGLTSDSNTNLERYYQREVGVKEIKW